MWPRVNAFILQEGDLQEKLQFCLTGDFFVTLRNLMSIFHIISSK